MIASSRRLLLQQARKSRALSQNGSGIVSSSERSSLSAVRWQHDSSSSPVAPPVSFSTTHSQSFSLQRLIAQQQHRTSSSRAVRHLATDANNSKKEEETEEKAEPSPSNEKEEKSGESLRDTVNRMKQKKKDGDDDNNTSDEVPTKDDDNKDFLHKAADYWDSFMAEVGLAWQDLIKAGERKDINKKLKRPEATAAGDQAYTGPVEIMVIDESEHLTAWERMQRRLTDAPIIQNILTKSEIVYEQSGAKQAKEKIDHLREDATEAWETSQNPWVYRASSVYDTLTAETAESIAVKELRVLDPEFTLDDWRRDVVAHSLPQIMEWFLQGKTKQLEPWLAEGVFKRIASEIAARQQEGVQIDTHVLSIMNSEILAVEVSLCVSLFVVGRISCCVLIDYFIFCHFSCSNTVMPKHAFE